MRCVRQLSSLAFLSGTAANYSATISLNVKRAAFFPAAQQRRCVLHSDYQNPLSSQAVELPHFLRRQGAIVDTHVVDGAAEIFREVPPENWLMVRDTIA